MNKPLTPDLLAVSTDRYSTHQVANQAQPASGYDAFGGDAVLRSAIEREAPWAASRCAALGAVVGDENVQELARLANRHTPELKTHDRFGNRIDWVEFHPSWHALMSLAWQHEVPNLTWRTTEKGGHFARAVLSYLWNQVEQGTACPTGMAYASHAGFEAEPALAIWKEKSKGTTYEFSRREVGDKPAVVIGYAMTEKQGGSDLRQTRTTARFSHSGDYHGAMAHWYELTGHKWFCSVPQSDGFFTLAKVNGGVTCFFLPRTLPDGSYNRFFVQRLKDKAGNESNASSEVEYAGTLAIRVGEEGRGIREILSHAHLTRLDFAVGSAGLMRQALTLALRHTTTRSAFGTPLADRPMMSNVLADMAVEVEAATLMALRVAKATDLMACSEHEKLLARIATPAAKFFNCSRAPSIAYEALQCHGGNGFIEENPMARLYREAPLNSVWEGTANMMCMDVRRAMTKDPRTVEALFDELQPLANQDARFDVQVRHTKRLVHEAVKDEFLARPMTEAVARVLQGAELIRHSSREVADVFLGTRSPGGSWGSHYGTLAAPVTQAAAQQIMRRAGVAD
ncbi:acyl-CoA dehydrogenase family protein [Verminephrobacter eiseniae]|uniref:Acyl-CoA dehydrogenase domain protein n=1 Tax=Verminephrobacter eiseniae (strain EF01-2) TaxID=391735 RepID=A1WK09_VEREI|nr:acyl-CoA dehydrogenase family protein [Verminephrobacter eiseniae]ABM57966.1 acyl-CoA dehydrogenase domain protein [Verminephrobacter eiseniae EF01-2]MCW5283571.1 acyl-CoA dehydrogenase [Verminephrobacter eiseniae]MCW5301280.1 acyl-CoA dehydrogenase [Verminephrobacter eiseniae]MCW8181158.1 acyl-CoA dehydrogenase [Verminephrobacter eiseniae]MCW8188932.1 acyl-CoA dehydrogenase [Verminephrobacter eiseniae]